MTILLFVQWALADAVKTVTEIQGVSFHDFLRKRAAAPLPQHQ
jgi:hypothetical protein